jgi:hypothetical protein
MNEVANKGGLLAAAALLLSAMAAPAHAQDVPRGSYLQTCTHVETHGDRLVADCMRVDGRWSRTALDLDRCGGGIANINGRLTCSGDRYSRDRDRYDRGYSGSSSPRR